MRLPIWEELMVMDTAMENRIDHLSKKSILCRMSSPKYAV